MGRAEMAAAAAAMTGLPVDDWQAAADVPPDDDSAALFLTILVAYRDAMRRGEVLPGEAPPEWYSRTRGDIA